jgi:uncharacterized protein with LGFP repeats
MASRTRLTALTLAFCVCTFAATIVLAFDVHGAIAQKWQSLGGVGGFLHAPLTNETATPDGVGRFNHFEGGSIYWTPNTGAHEVHGQIRNKWESLGWERSFLGYPISDETDMHDGRGRFSSFQGGAIYWSQQSGAHTIYGPVRAKWIAIGRARDFGYPTNDETATPDNRGQFVHFENGSIYWTQETGAHEVHGNIRDKWESLHWERGPLGYPTSDEFQDGAYRRSNFQHGFIRWSAETGAKVSRSSNID